MKCNVSIPERMKDLRVERHLSLEELEAAVGISKSALGSYESTEGCKEINHGSILKLADFYQVSTDYLLCRTDNRNPENIELTELHINDEVVELLKSERFNNRLLCEIISHEKFRELLADAEIYVDGIATMRFHDMNSSLAAVRAMILEAHPEAAADRAIKVLEACQVGEEDFFCHVTHKTWDTILHDIRKAHENDSESAPDTRGYARDRVGKRSQYAPVQASSVVVVLQRIRLQADGRTAAMDVRDLYMEIVTHEMVFRINV